jgi:hypothetical protein
MRNLTLATALLVGSNVLVCSNASGQGTASSRPNIVILYTDDQGYGDCRALNEDSKFATPNLDRLAAEGMSFTDGHCARLACWTHATQQAGRHAADVLQLGAVDAPGVRHRRAVVRPLRRPAQGVDVPHRSRRDWADPVVPGRAGATSGRIAAWNAYPPKRVTRKPSPSRP